MSAGSPCIGVTGGNALGGVGAGAMQPLTLPQILKLEEVVQQCEQEY